MLYETSLNRRYASLVGILGVTATVAVLPAFGAESDSGYVEEIVVTARKRAERLQDIPGSAAALTSSFIDDIGGITSLRDITDQIIGISINETASATLAEPTIRGAGQSRNRASVSATGLYRNGAYFATNGFGGKNFARFDSYDLERVEVLRGPQGALYGRNALGGSMNLISKKARDEFDVEVKVSTGEKHMSNYDVKVNIPVNDQFAMRASHVRQDRDKGFFTDINGDSVDVESYRHSRLSLRFRPTENLDINYTYDTQELVPTDVIYVVRSMLAARGSEFVTTINSPHFAKQEVDNHNLLIDWDLGNGVLSSVTNLRNRDVYVHRDIDYTGSTVALATRNRQMLQTLDNRGILFQEIRYVANGTETFKWLVGADYFSHDGIERRNSMLPGTQTWGNSRIQTTNMATDSWAVYANGDYRFDALPVTLSVEGRFAFDETSGDVLTFRKRLGDVPQTDFADKDEFTNTLWGVTASYRFEDMGVFSDALAYLKIATGYRHGGINLNAGDPDLDLYPVKLVYGEEKSLTYELGLKTSLLSRKLNFNLAAFYTFYQEFLNTTTNGCPDGCTLLNADSGDPLGYDANGDRIEFDADGNAGENLPIAYFIDNIGEVEAWGIEAEFTYRTRIQLTGGDLRFNAGWSRGLGKVEKLGSGISTASLLVDQAQLNYIRPKQIKSTLIYRQPVPVLDGFSIFHGATLLLSSSYTYEKGGFRTLSYANPWPLDKVSRASMRFGLETDHWSLMMRGSNITDASYETYGTATVYRRITPAYYSLEFTYRLK